MSKRVLWVVEVFVRGEWIAYQSWFHESRQQAREESRWARINGKKTRVVKYVPA